MRDVASCLVRLAHECAKYVSVRRHAFYRRHRGEAQYLFFWLRRYRFAPKQLLFTFYICCVHMNVLWQSEHFYCECIFIVRVSFARKLIKNYVKNDYRSVLSHCLSGKTHNISLWLTKIQETLGVAVSFEKSMEQHHQFHLKMFSLKLIS